MKYLDAKMKKMLIILFGMIVVLVVGALIINAIKGSSLSYEKIEEKLLDAAKDYYSDNENLLPLTDDDVVEVTDSVLSENDYMKPISKYQKDTSVSCSGKVVVTRSGKYYNYSPYLNCGDKYTTVYLYEKVLEDLVEKDDGLYKTTQYTSKNKTENVYIYKGDYVDNYVKVGDYLWRIVKLDSNYNIMLVQEYTNYDTKIVSAWDNRYNTTSKDNSGINDYYKSIVRKTLSDIYESDKLPQDLKSKIVVKDLCVNGLNPNDTSKNNKTECSKIVEGDYLRLLTVSDFMSASLASNCKSPLNNACGNYNYLTDYGRSNWLLNYTTTKNYKGYKADNNIFESTLSNESSIRVAFFITSNTVFAGGTGTAEDPYIIK